MLGAGSLRSLRSSLPVMTSSEPSLAFDDVQARARCGASRGPRGCAARAASACDAGRLRRAVSHAMLNFQAVLPGARCSP